MSTYVPARSCKCTDHTSKLTLFKVISLLAVSPLSLQRSSTTPALVSYKTHPGMKPSHGYGTRLSIFGVDPLLIFLLLLPEKGRLWQNDRWKDSKD